MAKIARSHKNDPLPVSVTLVYQGKERIAGPFTTSFTIGRDDVCDVTVPAPELSRTHVTVLWEDGAWWLVDAGSSNGTYLDGKRIERHEITGSGTYHLAANGPRLTFGVSMSSKPKDPTVMQVIPKATVSDPSRSLEQVAAHYLSAESDRPAGEHTMMIRRAFQTVQKKEKKKNYRVLGATVLGAALIIMMVLIMLVRAERARKAAEESIAALFGQIKELELVVAQFRAVNENLDDPAQTAALARAEEQLRSMNESYEATIVEYGIRRKLTPEEQIIHRIALVFRESEIEIPSGFVREVKAKINDFWLKPANLRTFTEGVRRAEENGYTPFIVDALKRNGLPPDFFYLALQESNLDPRQVAYRNTRWGWAKGMWQFIPATGRRYDLEIGPLWEENVYDPQDDRHDFEKSTAAAAQYLSEIYRTLAQASGLLVVASYNWGEFGVARKLEALPDPAPFQGMEMNPNSRSYWRFYTEYRDRIPDETRDYVLKIFSLAVLGSNPRYYGIDMDDPLAPYR